LGSLTDGSGTPHQQARNYNEVLCYQPLKAGRLGSRKPGRTLGRDKLLKGHPGWVILMTSTSK
jgi:hypothetical protein